MKKIALIFLEEEETLSIYTDFFSWIEKEREAHLFQGITLDSCYPEYPLEFLQFLKKQTPGEEISALFVSDIKDLTVFAYRFFHGVFSDFIWIIKDKDEYKYQDKIGFEFYSALSGFSNLQEEPFDYETDKIYTLFNNKGKRRWLEAFAYDPDIFQTRQAEDIITAGSDPSNEELAYQKKYYFNGQFYYLEKNDENVDKKTIMLSCSDNSQRSFHDMNERQIEKFVDFLLKYGIVEGLAYEEIITSMERHLSPALCHKLIAFLECGQEIQSIEQKKLLIYLYSLEPTYENIQKIFSVIEDPDFDMYEQKFIYWQLVALLFSFYDSLNGESFLRAHRLYGFFLDKVKTKYKGYFDKLCHSTPQKNRILIVAGQMLSNRHAPTRRVIDYAIQYMEQLHYEVMIVNTCEMPVKKVELPFHGAVAGSVEYIFNGIRTLILEEQRSVRFFQIQNEYKDEQEMEALVGQIHDFSPAYVFSVGASNLLADLLEPYFPLVTICCGYEIPVAYGGYYAFGREIEPEDIQIMERAGIDERRAIETLLTFKKPETENEIIEKSEREFSICIVGNRLDIEINEGTIIICDQILSFDNRIKIKLFGEYNQSSFEEKIEAYSKYPDRFLYEGYQNDILSAYRACDVYYNPKRNGGGSSVAQAMLMGLPILCHKFGDGSYVVGRNRCFEDLQGIVEELRKLFYDKQYYQKSQEYSLERAKKIFNTGEMIVEFDQIVRERINLDRK